MTKMICGLVLISSLAWAEDAPPAASPTTSEVQAVPSDTVKYPDASQVLNKSEPKATPATDKVDPKAVKSALPVTKLVAAKPLPAAASTTAPAAVSAAASAKNSGWFLKWELADEPAARAWAASLKRPADVNAAEGHWEVWTGPLAANDLALLSDQAGKAVLVRK